MLEVCFKGFNVKLQKKVTWLLTSIAQCTPFGMHHLWFKIDLGYTWLHPPKPSMSPKKGTWNTVHLPTIDVHCFSANMFLIFRAVSPYLKPFCPSGLFFDSCLISPSTSGVETWVQIAFICQWNLCISKAIYGCFRCFLKWWYLQNTPKWSFLVGNPHGCWVPPF